RLHSLRYFSGTRNPGWLLVPARPAPVSDHVQTSARAIHGVLSVYRQGHWSLVNAPTSVKRSAGVHRRGIALTMFLIVGSRCVAAGCCHGDGDKSRAGIFFADDGS